MPPISPDRVRAILEDLYALDPSLRAQGEDLARIVTELMAARPNVSVDAQFVASLRRNLQQRASSSTPQSSFLRFIPTFMQKPLNIILPLSGVAAIALVILVTVVNPNILQRSNTGTQNNNQNSALGSGVIITDAGANAFGNLAYSADGSASESALGSAVARSQSGGGGGNPMPSMPPMATDAKMAAPGYAEGSMIAPSDMTYERYRYVYKGDALTLDASATVYRRDKRPLGASGLSSALQSFNAGSIDLEKFGQAQLQQFTLIQPGQFGYQIYVDLNEGMVNVSENWATWPHPEAECRDDACYERLRIRPEDVPADDALIAVADAFLNEHGISKEAYGTPVVDRRWNTIMPMYRGEAAADTALRIYVPDTISLTYPIMIDGVTSYDQSGFPYGLSVSVDVRNKRVRGVWNLSPQSYQSSRYDAVTDEAQILDMASRGDMYSQPFGSDPNEKIVDVEIGTPERVLVQAYRTNEAGQGEELLVPALRFPVIGGADPAKGGRDSIVIPLVKDLLNPPFYLMKGMGGSGTAPAMPVATPTAAPAPEPAIDPAVR